MIVFLFSFSRRRKRKHYCSGSGRVVGHVWFTEAGFSCKMSALSRDCTAASVSLWYSDDTGMALGGDGEKGGSVACFISMVSNDRPRSKGLLMAPLLDGM